MCMIENKCGTIFQKGDISVFCGIVYGYFCAAKTPAKQGGDGGHPGRGIYPDMEEFNPCVGKRGNQAYGMSRDVRHFGSQRGDAETAVKRL